MGTGWGVFTALLGLAGAAFWTGVAGRVGRAGLGASGCFGSEMVGFDGVFGSVSGRCGGSWFWLVLSGLEYGRLRCAFSVARALAAASQLAKLDCEAGAPVGSDGRLWAGRGAMV